MTRIVPLLCVLTSLAPPAAATESEWPGWLGPHRDGKSMDTGLLKQWPDEGPTLLWQVNDIGVGFSSVAVAGGKVYVTGDKDKKLVISALDLDGNLLWRIDHGRARGGPDGSRATPVIDNGHLYLRYDTRLYCFNVR